MSTIRQSRSLIGPRTATALFLGWLALLVTLTGAFVMVGAAQEDLDEIGNETIETTENTTYVELDVEFAATLENTSEETVEVTFYEESAFNDSGTAATVIHEDSVTGGPNDTVTQEYTLSDTSVDLTTGTEYRVIVEAGNENNVQSGYVAPDDSTIGGGFFDGDSDGSPGFGVGVAIAAIGTAAIVARKRGGAGE